MKIFIGSRGSKLARWQAEWVRRQLAARGHQVEIKVIKTSGDKFAGPLPAQSGTKGLFVKEIEEALAAGEIDLAVHSLKDLPTDQPKGLIVQAVPEREDARDVFISKTGRPFDELPLHARVGTGSPRRQTQLRSLRADLEFVSLRGNIDTRLRKLDGGECDGLVLAAAGVHRLGLRDRVAGYFAPDRVCPAVGQGALAIEIRRGDLRLERAVEPLDHARSHRAVRAERAALRHLGGGCLVPIAAHATDDGRALRLIGVVASLDGSQILRTEASGPSDDPEKIGAAAAQKLLGLGAREILDATP